MDRNTRIMTLATDALRADGTIAADNRLIASQSIEYDRPLASILDERGIPHVSTEVDIPDYSGPIAITRHDYASPQYGAHTAYEVVERYDIDGFAQTVYHFARPVDGMGRAAARRIDDAVVSARRDCDYIINEWLPGHLLRPCRRRYATTRDDADRFAQAMLAEDVAHSPLIAISAPSSDERGNWTVGGGAGWDPAIITDHMFNRG